MRKTFMYDKDLVNTALGVEKADLIIRGGQLVNVLSEEILDMDVAIKGKRIAYVGNVDHCIGDSTVVVDVNGSYLTPGLIDGHIHPEVCKLSMTGLAEAMLPCGTTTLFVAMDDAWAVFGKEGVKAFLEEFENTPLRAIYHPYSRVPVTGLKPESTVPFKFGSTEMKEVMEWPNTVGPMDMIIDFIIGHDPEMLELMKYVQEQGVLVHGHDPMESGARMQALLTTGIRSDHVPITSEELLEKLRVGMWVMLCESPIAHVLPKVIKAITETNVSTRHLSFCVDDIDARDIYDSGHIDFHIKEAIRCGLKPIHAIQMATLNAAEAHRVDHLIGSIAPGKFADILVVDDLAEFTIRKVFASGKLVVEDGRLIEKLTRPSYPASYRNTFHIMRPLTENDLVLTTDTCANKVDVTTILVDKKDVFREKSTRTLAVVDGVIQPDLENDVLYCAVVERHKKTGNIGLGFISGFNLNGGTISTSLAPPDGNIICVGSNPQDMAIAINHTVKIGGGQIAVKDGKIVSEVPLPIGGIISDQDPEIVAEQERQLTSLVHSWGCDLGRPFFYLMFMEIVGIPELSITEHGLVDFWSQSYIDPCIKAY